MLIHGKFRCKDWGHARDYVEMQWLMLQQDSPKDYVIATGQQISVREFLNRVFLKLDIEIEWQGEGVDEIGIWKNKNSVDNTDNIIVRVDKNYFRPTEVETLLGDVTKAKKELGWRPRVSIDELIIEMVESDKQKVKEELTLMQSRTSGDK